MKNTLNQLAYFRHNLEKKIAVSTKTVEDYLITGFIGDADGLIEVPNRDHFVYVRGFDAVLREVFNPAFNLAWNAPVIFGFTKYDHNNMRLVAVNEIYTDPQTPHLLEHGDDHSYGGIDPVAIWMEQFMFWKVVVEDGMILKIHRAPFRTVSGVWVEPDTELLDLSPYVPTSGARWAYLEVLKTGVLNLVLGDVNANRYGLTLANLPNGTAGAFTLAAITLYVSQTVIRVPSSTTDETDIVDLRFGNIVNHDDNSGLANGSIYDIQLADGDGNFWSSDNFRYIPEDAKLQFGTQITFASSDGIYDQDVFEMDDYRIRAHLPLQIPSVPEPGLPDVGYMPLWEDSSTKHPMAKNSDGEVFDLVDGGASEVDNAIVDGVTDRAPSQNAVFDALALKANLNSPSLTGVPSAPTQLPGDSSTKIATTEYADLAAQAAVNNFDIKLAVRAASQANLSFTRSGNIYTATTLGVLLKSTIDSGWSTGDVLAIGDRLLLANQTSNVDNGIVIITDLGTIGTNAILTRSSDADVNSEITSEMRVPVSEGTDANIDYKLSSPGPFVINTTALPFTRAGGPPTGVAGGELSGTYPNPSVTNASVVTKVLTGFAAGAGSVSSADSILTAFQKIVGNIALKLTANSPITGATKTKITYDTNGLVTSGTDIALTDFPSIASSTILGNNSGGSASPSALTATQIRTLLSLVIGTNVQAYNSNLTTYAGITPSANVQSVLSATDYAAIQVLLGLVIGVNVQAYDANYTKKYSTTLTGGAYSEIVTHSLGSRDVDVAIYLLNTPYSKLDGGINTEMTSANTITIRMSSVIAASTYRVVVTG